VLPAFYAIHALRASGEFPILKMKMASQREAISMNGRWL
jgi:hypothetical protein